MSAPTTPDGAAAGVVGWVDVVDLTEREGWASQADPGALEDALEAAHDQCVEFLPARVRRLLEAKEAAGEPIPARFRMAQELQARGLVRSAVSGPDGEQGMDGLEVTVFPMDWTVKALLRPKRRGRGPR